MRTERKRSRFERRANGELTYTPPAGSGWSIVIQKWDGRWVDLTIRSKTENSFWEAQEEMDKLGVGHRMLYRRVVSRRR